MFSYRSILKQAWNISRKNKYLWVFGLFASVAAASGSFEYQLLVNNFQAGALENSYYHLNMFLFVLQSIGNFILGFFSLFTYDILTIINTLTVLIITIAIIIAFLWLSITSQGALVINAKQLFAVKKKEVKSDLRDGFSKGNEHFWPVLGFNLLTKLAIAVILFIISLPLVLLVSKTASALAFLYTLAFVIFVPVAVAVSLMIKYAISYQVLENDSFCQAIKKSWRLFTDNWLISLEMGLILFLISFAAGFIILFFLSVFIFPYFVFAVNYGFGWLIVLLAMIALFVILLASALLSTFQISAWTNLFLELREGKGAAKLERLFKKR